MSFVPQQKAGTAAFVIRGESEFRFEFDALRRARRSLRQRRWNLKLQLDGP
jgi:hypothetical protein